MCVRTHHDRAISRSSFFTKEHGIHGLAEESLTLFPDVVRRPLFTTFSLAIGIALLGTGFRDERELVGRGQSRKGGA